MSFVDRIVSDRIVRYTAETCAVASGGRARAVMHALERIERVHGEPLCSRTRVGSVWRGQRGTVTAIVPLNQSSPWINRPPGSIVPIVPLDQSSPSSPGDIE